MVELENTAQQGQVAIRLLHDGNRPFARIDGKDVPQSGWQATLRNVLRGGKSVFVIAGGDASYADVIGLIDSARAAGAQAVILKRS